MTSALDIHPGTSGSIAFGTAIILIIAAIYLHIEGGEILTWVAVSYWIISGGLLWFAYHQYSRAPSG